MKPGRTRGCRHERNDSGSGGAGLLARAGIRGLGSGDFAFHREMLGAGKYQIENLANLDAMPPTGATVVIGVLPVREGTQAQARVLAFLPG